jgi:hypothetical protein
MKRLALLVLVIAFCAVALSAAAEGDEPAIRPDPRPADLTTGRKGTNYEPAVRPDPRPLDLSAPKQSTGRTTLEIEGLTLEQSDRIRAIRARAEADIQAIRDRERGEIMLVLDEQQRAEFLKRERAAKIDMRRPTTTPATAPALP